MFWFNLTCGLASVFGLGLSVWALVIAQTAKRRVDSLERHEDALGMLRELHRAQFHIQELQRSTSRVWPRSRSDSLADALASVESRRTLLTPEEREALDRFTIHLFRGDVEATPRSATHLRAAVVLLAKIEARFAAIARTEVKP